MAIARPSLTDPIRPVHWGAYRVTGTMEVRDLQNRKLRDITDYVIDARVVVDWDADIKYRIDVTLEGYDIVRSLQECLAPFMTVEWRDTNGKLRKVHEQLGLYLFLPSPETHDPARQITKIQGMDVMWALGQLTTAKTHYWPQGYLHGHLAGDMLYGQTRVRMNIPVTTARMTKTRTVRANVPALPQANWLYKAAGYYSLRPDRRGLVSTTPLRELQGGGWDRLIETAAGDVFDTVEIDPDPARFCNQVYIRSNDPQADAARRAGYRTSNNDRSSPWSVRRLGYVVSKELMDDRDATIDVMKARARTLLQRANSLTTRVKMNVVPDPRFSPHEIWRLDVRSDWGKRIAVGLWSVQEMEFRFGGNTSGIQTVTVGKNVSLGDVD